MSYIDKRSKGYSWRKKVLCNLLSDLIIYESIETSLLNAKILTKLVSKLVGFAKNNSEDRILHSKRLALRYIGNNRKKRDVLSKLFYLGEKYSERNGGYTRINKLYHRIGDNALRVAISFV